MQVTIYSNYINLLFGVDAQYGTTMKRKNWLTIVRRNKFGYKVEIEINLWNIKNI